MFEVIGIGNGRNHVLIAFRNLAKSVPIAAQAVRHQIGIAESALMHCLAFHSITL